MKQKFAQTLGVRREMKKISIKREQMTPKLIEHV